MADPDSPRMPAINAAAGWQRAHSATLENSAFQAVNQVLMGLTHALANLLMPLREYPRLIQRKLPADSPAAGLLSNVEMAADRLCDINQNLTQLCHGNESTPSEVDLIAIAQQALAEVADQYPAEREIRVDLQCTAEPTMLLCPMDAVYHAIRNICVNAYEAMKAGGTLTLTVDRWRVTEGDDVRQLGIAPGVYLGVQIRDTGPGVDPLVRDKLFDPFVTTIRGEGRGLGLSQVYRTVRQLEGSILFNPDCAPGAAFVLLFPSAP